MAKAKPIPDLHAEDSYAEAAAKIVEVRAGELIEHGQDVLDTGDIERVHDMRVATRRLRAAMEIFAPCFPKSELKRTLRDVKALADALGMSLPTASRAIDGLLKRGLVTRTEDARDRRVKQIALTDDGRAITRRVLELRLAGVQDFVASLSAAERERLQSALEPIVSADA